MLEKNSHGSLPLFLEDVFDALRAAVQAAGGAKCVAGRLWPAKPTEQARKDLLDCLNRDNDRKLCVEEVMAILRMAREAGYQIRSPALRLHHDEMIVDNFAGGGGASLGIEWALGRSPDIAINHDPQAIAMHAANHPATATTARTCGRSTRRRRAAAGRSGSPGSARTASTSRRPRAASPSQEDPRARVDRRPLGEAGEAARHLPGERRGVQDWGPLAMTTAHDPERRGLTFRMEGES
jgi:hypothetical protein